MELGSVSDPSEAVQLCLNQGTLVWDNGSRHQAHVRCNLGVGGIHQMSLKKAPCPVTFPNYRARVYIIRRKVVVSRTRPLMKETVLRHLVGLEPNLNQDGRFVTIKLGVMSLDVACRSHIRG
jgi:hypothetical protein